MKKILIMAIALMGLAGLVYANEIGHGSGSSYPYTLDRDTAPETADNYAREDVPNDIASAVIAVEVTLGSAPAGAFADVASRLNAIAVTTTSAKDVDCRRSTGTIAVDIRVSTETLALNLTVSTKTIADNHITSMTAIDTILTNIVKSTGITQSVLNTFISTAGAKLDSVAGAYYVFAGTAGAKLDDYTAKIATSMVTIDGNQTLLGNKTFTASTTFNTAMQGTSIALANGATVYGRLNVKQINSGIDLGSVGDVYTHFTTSDSWAKATGSASPGGGIKWAMHLYPQQARALTNKGATVTDWEKEDAFLASSVTFATVGLFDTSVSSQYLCYVRTVDNQYAGGNVKCNIILVSSAVVTGTVKPCIYISTIGYTNPMKQNAWTEYKFPAHTVSATAYVPSSATLSITAPFTASNPVTVIATISLEGTFRGTIGVVDIWFEE